LFQVWNRKTSSTHEQEWVVKMKDFIEQDQHITRDLEKYQLAPPSPDLHDRVLIAAREAMAKGGDAELLWSDRWLTACRMFRQEILAFASALMLLVGVVMQLAGGQSVLANSLERLKTTNAVYECLHRAISMDCTIMKSPAGEEHSQYRVRWNAAGGTRIDLHTTNVRELILWILEGSDSVAYNENGSLRSMAITAIPSDWQPAMEFLTPAILAQTIRERYGSLQAEQQDKDRLLLIGRENRKVIEISIDAREYLPTRIKKYLPDSPQEYLEEVRFQWNKPLPKELLVPGSTEVKRQAN
jgi:hypothetical protein